MLTSIKVHFTVRRNFPWAYHFNFEQFWNITSGIYAKYHVQIMLSFVYTTARKGFVSFTADPLSLHTLVTSHWPFNNAPCTLYLAPCTYLVVIVTVGAPWTSQPFPSIWFCFQLLLGRCKTSTLSTQRYYSRNASFMGPFYFLLALFLVKLSW